MRGAGQPRGIPQGAPISHCWRICTCAGSLRMEGSAGAKASAHRIVTYADDLVILCRGKAAEAWRRKREIMGKLKLTVNEEKTRIERVPEGEFDFLGTRLG